MRDEYDKLEDRMRQMQNGAEAEDYEGEDYEDQEEEEEEDQDNYEGQTQIEEVKEKRK